MASNLDAQHQRDRDNRKQCKNAKADVQWDFGILESTESPIGKTAEADAYEVHDAVSCGTLMGTDDLGEDRHVVAIEKSPAQSKEDQKACRHHDICCVAHTEDSRDDHRHAKGADVDPASKVGFHPSVRKRASASCTENRSNLPVKGRRDSRGSLSESKAFLEDCGHPVADYPAGHGRESEVGYK